MNHHSIARNPTQPLKGLPAQISNTTQQQCLHASAVSFPTNNKCGTRLPPKHFLPANRATCTTPPTPSTADVDRHHAPARLLTCHTTVTLLVCQPPSNLLHCCRSSIAENALNPMVTLRCNTIIRAPAAAWLALDPIHEQSSSQQQQPNELKSSHIPRVTLHQN